MDFPHPGTEGRKVATFKSMNGGEKLLVTENAGATEGGIRTCLNQTRHAANVVVVPMCSYDESDDLGRIEIEAPQIVQGRWRIGASTRINQDPGAAADVQHDTFAIPGTQKSQLELVVRRRMSRNRHRSNARIVSRAHFRPSRKSRSVILGRSRNTICDTRFFVPAGDRS